MARAYSSFCSMKQLRVATPRLDGMLQQQKTTTTKLYLHEKKIKIIITNTDYLQIAKLVEAGSMETYHLHFYSVTK